LIDIIIVFSYLLLTLIFGVWVGKNVGSANDYKTGGRKYSALMIFAALSASFMGGGFTIGLAEKTFLYGFVYILAIWGFSFKEILIANFIAPRMKFFHGAQTVGDVMEKSFGTRTKIITGIASVLVCGGMIGAQIAACGSIIHILLGPPPAVGALLAASIVTIYATLGGMKAVIAVDVLQFSMFAVMIPIVLFFGLQYVGGISVFLKMLPEAHLSSLGSFDLKTLGVLFVSFFLGETLIPPYFQRLLIGKTINETKWGTLLSGVFSIFFFLVIGCIGMIALIIEPGIHSAAALPYVIQTVMPIGLKGLAIAAMVAIIMSYDPFLNSIAIAFSNDILKPLGLMKRIEKQELFINRLVTLTIGIIGIIISLTLTSALDVLLYSYQFWTPFILTPFIAALFGIRSSDKAFIISATTGVLGVVFWKFFNEKELVDGMLEGTILGVLLNTLVFTAYHLFSRYKESRDLRKAGVSL